MATHGYTVSYVMDGMLDELSRLYAERANALDALAALVKERPELESDQHVTLATLALL